MKISVERAKLARLFSAASSHPLSCSRFHICLHYPDYWSLFYPVLTSGCSNDLNGTGQGYVQSVCSLLYAMMRWLLRSLMSAGGTRSFFTGVGDRVERLPLGLNKSDTKNTCGGNRKHLNHCKVANSKSESMLLTITLQKFVLEGRNFYKVNKA